MDLQHISLHGRLFQFRHKFWELELAWLEKGSWTDYFSASIRLDRRTDHAGFRVALDVMRFSFEFIIYDHRHWNYEKGEWEVYNTEV